MNEKTANKPLTSKERKSLGKQRRSAAKQAQKYHKEQARQQRKSPVKSSAHDGQPTEQHTEASHSKIQQALLRQKQEQARQQERRGKKSQSREAEFRRKGKAKIRKLKPKDYKDGYYIDEFGEKQKQERRAKEIRAQENEVIRKRKKSLTSTQIKRRRIALYSSIFLAVLTVGIVLSLTVLFKTEKIEVVGDKYYTDEQIIAFAGVEYQENIFIGAIYNTAEKIPENLSYIESASVSFNIPDTITITVVDATPAYVVPDGSTYLLVSSKGRILDNVAENTDSLPELTCGELETTEVGSYVSFGDSNIPDILASVSQSIETNGVEKITAFDVTDTANITLVYDGRIKINIGLPSDIDYKIRTAMTIINEKLDPNNTGTAAGTLDVSACSTNKISHYKPDETQPTVATAATSETTSSDDSGTTDYSYTWDGTDYGTGTDYSAGYDTGTGTDYSADGGGNLYSYGE